MTASFVRHIGIFISACSCVLAASVRTNASDHKAAPLMFRQDLWGAYLQTGVDGARRYYYPTDEMQMLLSPDVTLSDAFTPFDVHCA